MFNTGANTTSSPFWTQSQALSGGNAKTFADVENAILNIKDAMQRTEDYLKEHTLAQ
jgi:hypothetical protein